MGGANFALTMPLFEQFEAYCRMKSAQYAALGMSRVQLLMEGNRQDFNDPEFEDSAKNSSQVSSYGRQQLRDALFGGGSGSRS
jgi:hypothetical protein